MKVGFIGLGKLGLPCAAAMSVHAKKEIYAYDVNLNIKKYIESNNVPYVETDIEEYLKRSNIIFQNSVGEVVEKSDIVFVAVQTPHEERFEGITPIPEQRSDFDYTHLIDVVKKINESVKNNKKSIDLVIISTVLPGTIKDVIKPIITEKQINLIYNPYFIAMGTTIPDFLNPEFILVGCRSGKEENLQSFYKQFISAPLVRVSIPSAEIVKVTYNTFIGMKIMFANIIGEIVEKTKQGCSDEVFHALSHANKRILSTAYMRSGMGDGGGCHPRDQIAMSWLAKKINLSTDVFEIMAVARENHAKYYAEIIKNYQDQSGKEVIILGESYKKNIGLTIGSPVKLLEFYLDTLGVNYKVFDPFIKNESLEFYDDKIFFVATPHEIFQNLSIPINSTVLDPWGNSIIKQYTVDYVNLGRFKEDF